MIQVILGLGSNLGNRQKELCLAIQFIESISNSPAVLSSLYGSKALGFVSENAFLNMVVSCSFKKMDSDTLLTLIKEYEEGRGREKRLLGAFVDRKIDIDILFFGSSIQNDSRLVIPHMEIKNREFVLRPLLEIANKFHHPIYRKRLSECYNIEKEFNEVEFKGILECT